VVLTPPHTPSHTSGVRHPLLRRAAHLIQQISQLLHKEGVIHSPVGNDLTHMLRSHLLSCPEYCGRSNNVVFEGTGRTAASRHWEGSGAQWASQPVIPAILGLFWGEGVGAGEILSCCHGGCYWCGKVVPCTMGVQGGAQGSPRLSEGHLSDRVSVVGTSRPAAPLVTFWVSLRRQLLHHHFPMTCSSLPLTDHRTDRRCQITPHVVAHSSLNRHILFLSLACDRSLVDHT